MSNRVYSAAIALCALVVLLPAAACAQQSARIRATARVIRSVLPETQMVAETQLENLRKAGIQSEAAVKAPVMSARGFAHIYTERLADQPTRYQPQTNNKEGSHTTHYQHTFRITVAYTAN